jgi:hypothetical protein
MPGRSFLPMPESVWLAVTYTTVITYEVIQIWKALQCARALAAGGMRATLCDAAQSIRAPQPAPGRSTP